MNLYKFVFFTSVIFFTVASHAITVTFFNDSNDDTMTYHYSIHTINPSVWSQMFTTKPVPPDTVYIKKVDVQGMLDQIAIHSADIKSTEGAVFSENFTKKFTDFSPCNTQADNEGLLFIAFNKQKRVFCSSGSGTLTQSNRSIR